MKKVLGLIAVLGMGAGAVAEPWQSEAVLVGPPTAAGCPVGLFAQRRAPGAVRLAGTGAPVAGGLSLLVGLEQAGAAKPVAATAELHGMPLGARPMQANGGPKGEASERFQLEPKRGERLLRQAVVKPIQLQGVSWVELTAIRFADGSEWHPSQSSRCVAEPNSVLLVSGR